MKRYNFNYLITNIQSGKQYVGAHTTNNINDTYFGSSKSLKNDIKLYGRGIFRKEIITFAWDFTEAKKNEVMYIGKYDTLAPKGYNKSRWGGPISILEMNSYLWFDKSKMDYCIEKAYELYSDFNSYSYDDYQKYKSEILNKDIRRIKFIKELYVNTLNKNYNTALYF